MSHPPAERFHEPMNIPGEVNEPDIVIVPLQPAAAHGPDAENIAPLGAPPVSVDAKPVRVTELAVAVRTMELTGPIDPFAHVNEGAGESV